MSNSWTRDCVIAYNEVAGIHVCPRDWNDEVLVQCIAMNELTGWIATLVQPELVHGNYVATQLQVYRPSTRHGNQYSMVLSTSFAFNIPTDNMQFFLDNDIFHFSKTDQMIHRYKIRSDDSSHELVCMESINLAELASKHSHGSGGSTRVGAVLFTAHLLLTFTGKRMNIYKLRPSLTFYHAITVASQPILHTYISVAEHEPISVYISQENRLSKFSLSRPEWERTEIVNSAQFGSLARFCHSRKYGLFWISHDSLNLYQSDKEHNRCNSRLLSIRHNSGKDASQVTRVSWSLVPNECSLLCTQLAELCACKYDESFGISGRLLLYARTHDQRSVVLQMLNNDELSLLHNLCTSGDLDAEYNMSFMVIFQHIYGDLRPVPRALIPDCPNKESILGFHSRVDPKSKDLKELLVDGFWRQHFMTGTVPMAIVLVCTAYYDGVRHWKFSQQDLLPYYPNAEKSEHKIEVDEIHENEEKTVSRYEERENHLYSSTFGMDGIEMKLSYEIDAEAKEPNIHLWAWLPEHIEKVSLYSEVFCSQNNAHFRDPVIFSRESYWNVDQFGQTWLRHYYPMYLNSREFEEFNVSAHLDISAIQYTSKSNKQPYFKPLCMKQECQFTWHVGTELMAEIQKAEPNQIFISQTFDEYNNNWFLWICPKDYQKRDLGDEEINREVRVALCLIKRPWNVHSVKVRATVSSSVSADEVQDSVKTCREDTRKVRFNAGLFKTILLKDLKEFDIFLHVEILSVNNSTEFMIEYPDLFE